jgi:hypothetical protein
MCKPHKHADLIKLWADGAEIESRGKTMKHWEDCPKPRWFDDLEYRIKPATIFINGYEVPEPVREAKDGQELYTFSIDSIYSYHNYSHCETDIARIKSGVAHLTQEAAELHRQALLSFTVKE